MSEARDGYLDLLRGDPNHFEALKGLTALAWRDGALDQAIAYAERAVVARMTPETLQTLGHMLHARCEHARAVETYRRALAINPAHAASRLGLAAALIDAGRTGEANIQLLGALEREGTKSDAQRLLGISAFLSGRYPEAEYYLRQASAAEPAGMVSKVRLASLYTHLGRPAEAAPLLSEVLRRDPANADAHGKLGLALLALGRFGDHRALRRWAPSRSARSPTTSGPGSRRSMR